MTLSTPFDRGTATSTIARRRIYVVAAVSAVLLTPSWASADLPELFDARWVGFDSSDFATARYVYGGVVADLDNDGAIDIATCTWPNIPRITVLHQPWRRELRGARHVRTTHRRLRHDQRRL